MTDSSSAAWKNHRVEIDTTVAHSARVWNYWLGGKDHYAADRELGDQILEVMPDLVESARADRAFLGRAVRYLVTEAGIRQFLDIGTGLPTANNTHEVAQAAAPECRVVYVDNDPIVLAHARALLTSSLPGATDYVDADLHEPDTILQAAARTLDFTQPVGGARRGDDRGRPAMERAGLRPDDVARPQRACPVLQPVGPAGARRGLLLAVAPRTGRRHR